MKYRSCFKIIKLKDHEMQNNLPDWTTTTSSIMKVKILG